MKVNITHHYCHVVVFLCLCLAMSSSFGVSQTKKRRHHRVHLNDQTHDKQQIGSPLMSACDNASDHTFTECLKEKCISPESILLYYNVSQDGINSTQTYLPDIPREILQIVKHICFHEYTETDLNRGADHVGFGHRKSSPAEAWGYGVGFVATINCISMVGAVLVPIMDKPFYKRTLVMLVALGVGAMAGTSIFVLIPEAFDLMHIEETAEGYKWKSATVVAALYVFYVWEQGMRLHSEWKKQKEEKKRKRQGKKKKCEETEMLEKNKESDHQIQDPEIVIEALHSIQSLGHSHGQSEAGEVATVAWIVLIADGIHKFVDGLTIGASFAKSVVTGLSVSVAILCEELPHELGDIAILVHSGMKMRKALLYNLLVSLPCLMGLAVGILLSEATSADKWIFAVAGGVFMYIALVDMLPEIRTADEKDPQYKTIGSKITLAFMQNVGLLIGFVIIFALVILF